MRVQMQPSALRETKWYEYAVRFVFGGLVTAVAGIIARKYGPAVGGLFLAFPAIFPASATLVEKHERQRKGDPEHRRLRGEEAAGVDAIGAAIGSVGLAVFGAVVWGFGPRLTAWEVLALATALWAAVAVAIWAIRQKM